VNAAMTTKAKIVDAGKSRAAAFVALFSDPAYEAYPFDRFDDDLSPHRRRRLLSSKRVIAQARKLGVDATIVTDGGTVTLRFGETTTTPTTSDDDEVESWLSRQKRH
jgi:hypothetical protein